MGHYRPVGQRPVHRAGRPGSGRWRLRKVRRAAGRSGRGSGSGAEVVKRDPRGEEEGYTRDGRGD